jgi:putative SOS response-associated peptidase YedK
VDPEDVFSDFDWLDRPEAPLWAGEKPGPRFNVAPTQPAIVIGQRAGAAPKPARFDWGFVPRWAQDEKGAARRINARSESISERPMFADSFRSRRCLVPVTGWFEWRVGGADRRPVHFHREGRLMTLAGVWDRCVLDGRPHFTFAILTRPSLGVVREVHHRMPVVVGETGRAAWLDPSRPVEVADVECLDAPLVATTVSTRVNSVRYDDPRCLEPDAGPGEDAQTDLFR